MELELLINFPHPLGDPLLSLVDPVVIVELLETLRVLVVVGVWVARLVSRCRRL